MKKILLTIFLLIGMFTTTANAVVLSSLYTDQVPISSRDAAIQKSAISTALKNVFIKVSGNAKVADIDEISSAIKNPDNYVRDFSYIQNSTDIDNPLILQVNFAPKSIDNLLNQVGQPIWKKNRPLTLIWLAVQDKSTPQLTNNNDDATVQLLTLGAKQRGLPIIFPILDLSDLQQIKPTDVWAPFIDVIQQASLRYSPNVILIIRLDQTNPNNLISHWSLLLKDNQMTWNIKGNDKKTILQAGINNVTNILAKQFAVAKTHQLTNTITMTVTNLKNIGNYAKVVHYLNGLSGITNVEVQNVSENQAKFNLTLSVDVETLQRTIQLSSMLSLAEPGKPNDNQTPETNLVYQLNQD